MIEGLGVMISGLWGSGIGLTSYSGNIGAIGITKVSSPVVVKVSLLKEAHCIYLYKIESLPFNSSLFRINLFNCFIIRHIMFTY